MDSMQLYIACVAQKRLVVQVYIWWLQQRHDLQRANSVLKPLHYRDGAPPTQNSLICLCFTWLAERGWCTGTSLNENRESIVSWVGELIAQRRAYDYLVIMGTVFYIILLELGFDLLLTFPEFYFERVCHDSIPAFSENAALI